MFLFSKAHKLAMLVCLLGVSTAGNLLAQQAPKDNSQQAPQDNSKPSASDRGPGKHGHGPHAGTWLRRYQKLPPAEQERALNNDPQFQTLPTERQEKLRRRLREFNSLPAEKRQRIIKRMELFEHLSPEQQQRARDLYGRLRTLPEDRRRIVKRTAHNLRQFDAAERTRLLESDPYRNSFNDNERSLIRELTELDLGPAAAEHRSEEPR